MQPQFMAAARFRSVSWCVWLTVRARMVCSGDDGGGGADEAGANHDGEAMAVDGDAGDGSDAAGDDDDDYNVTEAD